MSYDKNTKTITIPVDTQDASAALGVGTGDVGRLCSSERVNPDALFRPYETGSFRYDHDLFKNGGSDGMYGYSIPMTENDTAFDLWMKEWSDKGRPDAHYHLLMFDGYNHAASFEDHPFGIRLTRAGSAWVVEYYCDDTVAGQVNPSVMSGLKDYYPALQVFEKGEPSTFPQTLPVFNWCGQNTISAGSSGEYLYDLNLEAGKTYYVIPFLSQYKFESKPGYMGRLEGKKYCLVYKDWKITDWAITTEGGDVEITEYTVHIDISAESSYTIRATFRYEFFVDLYIIPTYKTEVYNALGQKVYEDAYRNVTSGFTGETGMQYSFGASLGIVNPSTGEPWPSGYIIRVHHKEQSNADGTGHEIYEDYIIP